MQSIINQAEDSGFCTTPIGASAAPDQRIYIMFHTDQEKFLEFERNILFDTPTIGIANSSEEKTDDKVQMYQSMIDSFYSGR